MIETVIAVILLLCSLIFTVKFGFYSPSKLFRTLSSPFFRRKSTDKNGVSPFSGLCTALGGCIGTGNIIGVTSCIMIGGIGSIFWVWVCAFLSLSTKYAEVCLSVAAKDHEGGSPMKYIRSFLGKRYVPLGVTWCILCLLSAVLTGSTVQSNSISEAVINLLPENSPFTKVRLICGIAIALLAFFILMGGLKRVSNYATAVVPFMCVIYLALCIVCIFASGKSVIAILGSIVKEAFNPSAVVSGGTAFTVLRAMRLGVSIGIFSNEAGMGTSTLAHSSTVSNDPKSQGALGMWEVIIDTFVVCTATALLVIACVPENMLYDTQLSPLYLVSFSLSSVFGDSVSTVLLSACTILFAFTSILGWSYYGNVCCEYLFPNHRKLSGLIYKLLFCIMLISGCLFPLGIVWNFSSTFNMILALPNVFALLLIFGKMDKKHKRRFKQP